MGDENGFKPMRQVIQIDEARIRDHLGETVRGTVERRRTPCWMQKQTSCVAQGSMSAVARQDTRDGSYERMLQTKARRQSQGSEVMAPDLFLKRRSSNAIAGGSARSRKQ